MGSIHAVSDSASQVKEVTLTTGWAAQYEGKLSSPSLLTLMLLVANFAITK